MPLVPPLAVFLLLFSGWVNRNQQAVIDYLLEENGVPAARAPRRISPPSSCGAFVDHYHQERPHHGRAMR